MSFSEKTLAKTSVFLFLGFPENGRVGSNRPALTFCFFSVKRKENKEKYFYFLKAKSNKNLFFS
jgi:hypothetical protein